MKYLLLSLLLVGCGPDYYTKAVGRYIEQCTTVVGTAYQCTTFPEGPKGASGLEAVGALVGASLGVVVPLLEPAAAAQTLTN